MAEFLSFTEIKTQFEAEWVLLEDPDTTAALEVTGGTVLFHSKDRDKVYRHARNLRPKHSAIIYTGSLPEDAVVVL